jgi:hypothetical protein
MQDYEKLGVFYLGRQYDIDARAAKPDLLLYESKDLLTHAVCVGMTGSGKTGLCIGLIEEAAIDGIPAILIDPKGDLANLMLTFPDLKGSDFLPWVNPDEARNKGLTPEAFAGQQAAMWSKGLAQWDEDGDRIRRLREAAEFAVYTPASSAGRQVSVLRSFAAPPEAVLDDREAMRERVAVTTSSLLSLAGIDADPVQSREHILLSTILDKAWRDGKDLDLAGIIQQIQSPDSPRLACSIWSPSIRARTVSGWLCRSTICWPRRGSNRGWRARRSTSARCCTRSRESRGWLSSPSPT